MRTLTRTPCYRHAKLSGYRLNLVPNISNFFFWHLFLNLLTSNEESEKIFNTGQKWRESFIVIFQGDNLLTGKALFNDVNNAPTDKLMDAFENKDGRKYGIILFKIMILIYW